MFLRRLGSAVFLIALVILSVWFSRGASALLLCGIAVLMGIAGTREYLRLFEAKGMRPASGYGTAAAGVYLLVVFVCSYYPRMGAGLERLAAAAILAGLFVLQASERDQRGALANTAAVISGLVYVAWLWSFIFRIVYFPGADGRWFLFALLLIVKGGDILAYAVGSSIGRHKLIPRISPGKTWEGAAGNVAGGLVAGLVVWAWFPCGLTCPAALGLGAMLTVVGQLGDIGESMLKRDACVKDSSGSIPGMGGALDVMDSLLLSLPAMYLYLEFTR
jgi:phosphatidate cytidylyltransferase